MKVFVGGTCLVNQKMVELDDENTEMEMGFRVVDSQGFFVVAKILRFIRRSFVLGRERK